MHRRDLPGNPDVVLSQDKVAVFVHGCFWHAHEGCHIARVPKTKSEFWKQKFAKNRERDMNVKRELERSGWSVVIFWECEVSIDGIDELLVERGLVTD